MKVRHAWALVIWKNIKSVQVCSNSVFIRDLSHNHTSVGDSEDRDEPIKKYVSILLWNFSFFWNYPVCLVGI